MDWVLSGLGIMSTVMLGKKLKWGWVVGGIAQLVWIYYAVFVLSPSQYGLVPMAAVVFVIAVASAWKWFREDIDK